MRGMLTRSGFTTVVDTASDLSNTMVLRRRVQSAEVAGPQIYTAGFALYPPHGIPFYLDDMAATQHAKLQDPATAIEACPHHLWLATVHGDNREHRPGGRRSLEGANGRHLLAKARLRYDKCVMKQSRADQRASRIQTMPSKRKVPSCS